jgi:hypothetical protein
VDDAHMPAYTWREWAIIFLIAFIMHLIGPLPRLW